MMPVMFFAIAMPTLFADVHQAAGAAVSGFMRLLIARTMWLTRLCGHIKIRPLIGCHGFVVA